MVKPTPLLACLPAPVQARLRAIGNNARDLFGKLPDFQDIFDAQVTFFDELAAGGASQPMLGDLLAAVGIARADGTPLPVGTISSALCRARERAAGRPAAPPASGMILQGPAEPGSVLPPPAGHGTPMPKPARHRRNRPAPAAAARRLPPSEEAGTVSATSGQAAPTTTIAKAEFSPPPADDRTAARNRRAASILNALRSKTCL